MQAMLTTLEMTVMMAHTENPTTLIMAHTDNPMTLIPTMNQATVHQPTAKKNMTQKDQATKKLDELNEPTQK